MANVVLEAALIVFAYVNLVHLSALLKRDNGIMDAAWGPGFVLMAGTLLFLRPGEINPRQLLLTVLVAVWGLRLALHILLRNAGRGEDFRYRHWRETWGRWFYVRSYVQIYLLQGMFMLIVAAPILLVSTRPSTPLTWLDGVGAAVWLTGFLIEAIGDYQLLAFMKNRDNHGKVMRSGLWGYSRHPNYFGEALLWWGGFLIALNVPGGWWALISPVVIDWLLLYVSGIPMLEAKYQNRPEYQEYQKTTSAFFPWFPHKR